ncbi:hypothetical protein TSUD_232250 [Trifolium subterraneum]|uniref:Uncharacterized protein n=1 Tax=Trifolium subterraneum TaxID=3900 RepID=A0A2Z6M5T0_TRISU|nr:hypothetical protein TSUD_232250 [Trifolium subterraneum]
MSDENMPIKKYDFTGTDVARRMVIEIQVDHFAIPRVNVNPKSQVDILYFSLFLQMEFRVDADTLRTIITSQGCCWRSQRLH